MAHHKLYVGCALTAALPEFRGSVEQLKKELASQWEVIRFGVADQLKKPTLIVAHRDATVSRLLIDAAEECSHIRLWRYDKLSDVEQLASEYLKRTLNGQ
ncbi:hypothetical protein CSA80_01290 [Candidatus Saccharibacteria bacterium]|nr:MAG: hypothetical protein CR973_01865 [Candidatus Saccharibacteria bacterium]PID99379.1 MAG: hypothetical protein CSA80_01290 [Candidatus Saccharibacteria bacterium]